MDLLQFLVAIIVLGLIWWVVNKYLPMPPAGKTALTIAFVVVVIVLLLAFLGVGTGILHYKPQLR